MKSPLSLAFLVNLLLSPAIACAAQPGDTPAPSPGKPLTAAQGTEIRTGNPPDDSSGKSQTGEGVYGASPSGPTTPPSAITRQKHPCDTGTVTSAKSLNRCERPH